MSTTLASGHVLIGAQVAPALAGMAKVNAGMEATAKKATSSSKTIASAWKPAALAIGGLALGAKKSIDAASDLNESINKSSVLFGAAAKTMPGFGESVAKSLGMSRNAALDNAAGIGAMLIPMGVAQKDAARMSSRMLTLAADLGSFHNADPTDMLDRLRAGLSGESEPLKKFGIVLTEARVKAEALRMGIAKQGATLTESQKLQARYSLAIRDAGKANGDFARTSGGLANQQRILSAQVTDLSAKLGAALLPAATKVVAGFSALVSWGERNQTTLKVVATVAASLGTAILVVAGAMKIAAIAGAAFNAVMLANPILLVVAAIAALAVGLVIAYKNSATFRAIVDGAFKAVANSAKVLVAAFNAVLSWVKGNWKTIAVLIAGPFAPLVALATNAFGIRSALTGAFSAMLGAAKSGMQAIVGAVKGAVGAATGAAKSVGKGIVDGVKSGLSAIRSIYSVMWSGISGAISSAAGAALGAAASIGRAIVSGAVNAMSGLAGALRAKAESAISSALSNLNPFSPVEHGAKLYIADPIIAGSVKGLDGLGTAMHGKINHEISKSMSSLAVVRSLQGQLDRINAASAAKDRALALSEAQRALADARKSGEGIAAAERALAKARQDITVAGIEARLAVAQRGYDREQALAERAKAKALQTMEAIKAAKSKAGDLASGLSGMIGQGIDALTGSRSAALGNSPEAQRLRAIEAQQRETARARDRFALDEAIRNAETDADRMKAQQDLDDWLLEQERQRLSDSLALTEQKIRDEAEAKKSAAERGIADLTDNFRRGLITYGQYMESVKALIGSTVGDYSSLGVLLGSAFVNGFGDQLTALAATVSNVAKLSSPVGPVIKLPGGPDPLPVKHKRAALGGIIGGSGRMDKVPVLAAPGEGILSHRGMDNLMSMAMGRGGGGGSVTVNVNLYDRTMTGVDRTQARRLADAIAPELNRRVSLAA